MANQSKTNLFNKRLIITSIIAGLFLVIVNSAIWINRQVFDTENFTNTAVSSITSESSRQALGSRITDEALKDNPVIKNIVGDRASNFISGLLGTDQARKLLTASASKLQIYVTSKNQQDVDIDLSGLKNTITRLVDVSRADQSDRLNPDKIPDKIVIVEEKNVPDLYSYGVVLNWLAPLGFLLAVVLLALPYFKDRKNYLSIMTFQGVLLIAIGLVSLLLGPLLRPTVLEPFQNPNGRVVIGNLYDAFIGTFNSQTLTFVYLGILVCIAAFVIKMFPHFKKLRK